jgi:hypothetical protein
MIEGDRLFGVVRKNAREELRIASRTFKGRRSIDIRIFTATADGRKSQTAKGVVIAPGDLDALIDALSRARISSTNKTEEIE